MKRPPIGLLIATALCCAAIAHAQRRYVYTTDGTDLVYVDGTNTPSISGAGTDTRIGNLAHLTTNQATANGWTWTDDGTNVTVTAYDYTKGGANVVIPDTIAGLPVTGIGTVFQANTNVASVGGAANVTALAGSAFEGCTALTSASFPAVTSLGSSAFENCTALVSVDLPSAETFGLSVFENCTALVSINLPSATTLDWDVFENCAALVAIYWGETVPTVTPDPAIPWPANIVSYYPAGATNWLALDPQTFPVGYASATAAVMVPAHATTLSSVALGRKTLDEIWANAAVTNDLYWLNNASAGRLWGGEITVNADGTINIAAGEGFIKSSAGAGSWDLIPSAITNGQGAGVELVSWNAISNYALVDNAYNLIYYDASHGVMTNSTLENFYAEFDFVTDFTVGRTYRDGTNAVARLCGMNRWNFERRVQMFGEERFPVERAFGLMIGSSGLQYSVSDGVIWAELVNRFAIDGKALTNDFRYWYLTDSTNWTHVSANEISNTQYNDPATGLVNLGGVRWRADYVYVVHDSTHHVVMGQDEYNSASLAQDAAIPAPPGLLEAYATLVGRITVQRNAATMTADSPFQQTFAAAAIPDHNELAGLQGGTSTLRFHGTNEFGTAAYSDVTDLDAMYVAITDGVATNLETAGTNFWSSGRVHYLPIDADIGAYIASAAVADGDTIQLASGTYTVTASITIGKSIHLRGQGRGKTTIACSTALAAQRAMIEPSVSNVAFSDFNPVLTNQTTSVSVFGRNNDYTNLRGWRFERLDIRAYGSSSLFPIFFNDNEGDVIDVDIFAAGGATVHGVRLSGSSSSTYDKTINFNSVRFSVSTSAGANAAAGIQANSAAGHTNNMTGNMRECFVLASNTGATGNQPAYGVNVQGAGANCAVNVYNSHMGGSGGVTQFDLRQTAGTLTVHGPVTLANGTTDGTITYAGTTAANRAHIAGPIRLANTTKPTALTGFGWIYAKTNEVYVLDGAGNETLISPHGGSDAWTFYSRNDYTGREIIVDMESMIRALERVSGEKLMQVSWCEPSRDWAADEAAKAARREADIAAWDAEAERRQFAEPEKDEPELERQSERPETYEPRPVPAWITDRLQEALEDKAEAETRE